MKEKEQYVKDYQRIKEIIDNVRSLPDSNKAEVKELSDLLEFYHYQRVSTREVLLEILQRPATLK